MLARRARVILACAEGLANQMVARKLRCMVGRWRARFLKGRLEALHDEPQPGAPRTVSDAQVEQVVIHPWKAHRVGKRTSPRVDWARPPDSVG